MGNATRASEALNHFGKNRRVEEESHASLLFSDKMTKDLKNNAPLVETNAVKILTEIKQSNAPLVKTNAIKTLTEIKKSNAPLVKTNAIKTLTEIKKSNAPLVK